MALSFLQGAPPGAERLLQAFASAESLTDDVARRIYDLAPLPGVPAALFVQALHYADFVEPRNSEWSFSREVRQELLRQPEGDKNLLRKTNELLLRLGLESDPNLAGSVIPSYLLSDAGRAYHQAGLGNTEEALALYGRSALGPLTGVQWLASNLSAEQEARNVLPPGRIETLFLRAMVLFREGRRGEAEPLLRRIAATDETRKEVAIALHILGNLVGRRDKREAEAFLLRSIKILEDINDRPGLAQTLHSYANLLARNPQRADDAESAYLRSIKTREEINDLHGLAQTLHSYANLLARNPDRAEEAETAYLRSIEIGEEINNQHHVAQTLHSYANLLARNPGRAEEAETAYLRSIEIDQSLRNDHGVAQTLHSYANLLARDPGRVDDAERLLWKSLQIGRDRSDLRHQAQVLRSLSFIAEHRSAREAKQLLEESLELNKLAHDTRGVAIVRRSLKALRDRYGV